MDEGASERVRYAECQTELAPATARAVHHRDLDERNTTDALLVRPHAHQRRGQAGGHEPGNEEEGNQTLGEGVLLLVQRVNIWTLQPVRPYMTPRIRHDTD